MQGQTGSYSIISIVKAPATYQLTTLANVRDDMDLQSSDTSKDSQITRYINEESAGIARYCNRIFGQATWSEVFRPARGIWGEGTRAANNPLKLTRWPLIAPVVSFTGNTNSNNSITGLTPAITQQLSAGQYISGPGIPAGTTISLVLATSLQLSAPTTATTAAVSLATGISVVETIAGTDTGLTPGVDFEIEGANLGIPGDEGAAGLYRLNQLGSPRNWPPAKISVFYTAGYVLPQDSTSYTLPPDLENTCIRLVVGRYQAKERDPMIRALDQPGLGRQEFWVGALPGQVGPYPNDIMAVLDRYRTPVIA